MRQSDALTKKKGRGKKSGVRQAARELGVSEPDARRAVKVDSLTPEAKAVAVEVGLDDNRTALLKAAEAPKDQQASVLTSIAVEKAKPTTSITFKTESHRAVKRSITSIVKSTVEDISAAAQNYENLAKQFGDLADLKGVSAADAREYVESIEGTISVLSKLRRALLKVSATSTEDPPLAGAHDGGARPSSDDARPTREAQ